MPVQTDAPIGIGTRNDWGLYGSAPNMVSAVAANDGNASVVFADSGGRQNLILYTFPLVKGTDPVDSASLGAVARSFNEAAQTKYFYFWWNGVQIDQNWGMFIATEYPNFYGVNNAAPDLSLAAVNGQHGFMQAGSGGPGNKWECWVTQFYRTVSYTYVAGAAGEFVHLIASLVGALIGSNLLLHEMPQLSREMAKRGVRLRPDEYEPAWKTWRAQKRLVLVG